MAKGHMHGFNMGQEKTLMERNILNILHNRETKVVIQSSCPRCHSTKTWLIVLMVEVKTSFLQLLCEHCIVGFFLRWGSLVRRR